ncbi:hypothetical protein F4809DRAFT_348679 [Biscogniauxia mediterranea]|nr:hypothetical protein F4809DRAFT_348679 [Biscogniauxia mediterranea]
MGDPEKVNEHLSGSASGAGRQGKFHFTMLIRRGKSRLPGPSGPLLVPRPQE